MNKYDPSLLFSLTLKGFIYVVVSCVRLAHLTDLHHADLKELHGSHTEHLPPHP